MRDGQIVESRGRQGGGWKVYTSVHDGRKYVKSDEVIKSERARAQMERLRAVIKERG